MTSENHDSGVTGRRAYLKTAGVSGIALATGLAGCTGNGGGDGATTTGTTTESGPDQVVIGSNHPLSGGLSYTGQGMDKAVKLAAKRKNDSGGIESLGGAEVKVISGDNEGKQSLGGQVEQNLIDKGASVITGCFASPVTAAATQAAERAGVPHVIDVAAADGILQNHDMNFSYRVHGPSKVSANDFAKWVPKIVRNAGETIETAGILAVNNNYGQGIAGHLEDFLPDHEVEVVLNEKVEFGASTADTKVSKLRNADPDLGVLVVYGQGGLSIAEAMKNQDYQPPFLGGCAAPAFSNSDTVSKMGSGVANGVLNNNFAMNPTIEKTSEIKSEFKEYAGQPMSALVGMGFTAANVIFEAIEQAGSTDPEAINEAMKTVRVTDHIQAMPPIEFDASGENPNAITPLTQIQDMSIKLVYPPEFAKTEPKV